MRQIPSMKWINSSKRCTRGRHLEITVQVWEAKSRYSRMVKMLICKWLTVELLEQQLTRGTPTTNTIHSCIRSWTSIWTAVYQHNFQSSKYVRNSQDQSPRTSIMERSSRRSCNLLSSMKGMKAQPNWTLCKTSLLIMNAYKMGEIRLS